MKSGFYDRLIAEKAARRIQRVYRQYRQRKKEDLDRRLKRLEYIKPQILTETKREQIIEQIETWKRERAVRQSNFSSLSDRCDKLTFYLFVLLATRSIGQRFRRSLRARTRSSSRLCSHEPSLATSRTTTTSSSAYDGKRLRVPHVE